MNVPTTKRIAAAIAAVIIFLPLVLNGEQPPATGDLQMTTKVKEWVQREWTQPGVDLYRERGDFHSLTGLRPDVIHHTLTRSPHVSSLVQHSGLSTIQAMFYDDVNERKVLIGKNAASNLASGYYHSGWTFAGPYELTTYTDTLGGKQLRNVAYFGGYLYVITDDLKVYRGSGYVGAITEFYATTDAQILAPLGGRLYAATTSGKILRLNDANTAFETHYDPVADYTPLYLTAFRDYLAIVGKQAGHLHIYRVPQSASGANPHHLQEAAIVPGDTGAYPANGCFFATVGDKLYLSPGRHTNPAGTKTYDIYSWNGSQLERVAQIEDTNTSPSSAGLLAWQGELVFYSLYTTTQTLKMLVGNQFVDFLPATVDVTNVTPVIATLGENIVLYAKSGADYGIHHTELDKLQDGHLISARLDMGHPGRVKRLDRITVLLDDNASDFKVIIKYRTNDATSWTTATTANNTRRATIGDLGVAFYTLQLHIELDDDTGNDENINIQAVSVIYTIDE